MSEKKRITIGILAHVDAGKTTLSEAMLAVSGAIPKAGRVDNGDSFLDTDIQERSRGITIFSGQAQIRAGGTQLILVDTPGHVDFSAEMERHQRQGTGTGTYSDHLEAASEPSDPCIRFCE